MRVLYLRSRNSIKPQGFPCGLYSISKRAGAYPAFTSFHLHPFFKALVKTISSSPVAYISLFCEHFIKPQGRCTLARDEIQPRRG